MTEHEIQIIDKSIEAYKGMIKYYENKIETLIAKKTPKRCFKDHIKIKFKIKKSGD